MCKRKATADPLLRTFFDDYGLHLLAIPRTGIAVGDVCIRSGTRSSFAGQVSSFLDPAVTVKPARQDEVMANVAGKVSDAVSTSIGANLLRAFLAAIGAGDFAGKVGATLESARDVQMRFRFAQAREDAADIGKVGAKLAGARVRTDNAVFNGDDSYFLVSRVARSPSISVRFDGEVARGANLDFTIPASLSASAKIKVKRADDGEVTFEGKTPLVFGVELYELLWDAKRSELRLKLPAGAVHVRSNGDRATLSRAWLDGDDGEAFADIR